MNNEELIKENTLLKEENEKFKKEKKNLIYFLNKTMLKS